MKCHKNKDNRPHFSSHSSLMHLPTTRGWGSGFFHFFASSLFLFTLYLVSLHENFCLLLISESWLLSIICGSSLSHYRSIQIWVDSYFENLSWDLCVVTTKSIGHLESVFGAELHTIVICKEWGSHNGFSNSFLVVQVVVIQIENFSPLV